MIYCYIMLTVTKVRTLCYIDTNTFETGALLVLFDFFLFDKSQVNDK